MIKLVSGLKWMENYIVKFVMQELLDWVEQVVSRWKNDMILFDKFYEYIEEKLEEYYLEKQVLKVLY